MIKLIRFVACLQATSSSLDTDDMTPEGRWGVLHWWRELCGHIQNNCTALSAYNSRRANRSLFFFHSHWELLPSERNGLLSKSAKKCLNCISLPIEAILHPWNAKLAQVKQERIQSYKRNLCDRFSFSQFSIRALNTRMSHHLKRPNCNWHIGGKLETLEFVLLKLNKLPVPVICTAKAAGSGIVTSQMALSLQWHFWLVHPQRIFTLV